MSSINMPPPPASPTALESDPKKKKRSLFGRMIRWTIYGLVIIGAVDIISDVFGGPDAPNDDAQLSVEADASNTVKITNVGRETLAVKNIRINDRDDCKANFAIFNLLGVNNNPTLKVGDSLTFTSNCQPIRLKVDTDRGDIELSLNPEQ